SDGRFTTPPLPPNRYQFQLLAMLASTPVESGQTYDLQDSTWVEISEKGPIPPVEIVVKPKQARTDTGRAEASDPKKPRLEIHAHDESGAPIKDFAAQLYSPQWASREESLGTDGLAIMVGDEVKGWKHGDLVVYAPGYASTILEIG